MLMNKHLKKCSSKKNCRLFKLNKFNKSKKIKN